MVAKPVKVSNVALLWLLFYIQHFTDEKRKRESAKKDV